ncbi:hypothetical protein acsn021_11190 [Anaerocolumna cellulosilytica]|uniref:Uncharacterized protein n=1 Tax=Anaerocolumna cellulosilytica TaxID=433286 RepID=A0A6S6R2K5_9FIRM|nr:hypothetical protein [Anaerocolumna cellulosilytica]MBB5194606.1 Tfp pilus assembly protein PilN [Anaerocolumna cellulosilytica]BCJ93550.1 hypothetical protein acsn021_11190 [Anaerocolumna cellulosilytica]
MNWEDILMDIAEITAIAGILGVIATILVGFLNNRNSILKLSHHVEELRKELKELGGMKSSQKDLLSDHKNLTKGQENLAYDHEKIIDMQNRIKEILNKGEIRYENLNIDQKEIRNQVLNLVMNYEKLVGENSQLRQENDNLLKVIKSMKQSKSLYYNSQENYQEKDEEEEEHEF